MKVQEKLAEIQSKLKAPKGQMNSFGGYRYRSCEDILEAVKPLLGEATLVVCDDMVQLGERYYVKATAQLSVNGEAITATAFAREPESKKGMDESQITGAASSYARKYALNGLFAIDDTKDADTQDNRPQANAQPVKRITEAQEGDIEALLKETGTDKAKFLGWLKVNGVGEILAKDYKRAVTALEKKRQ